MNKIKKINGTIINSIINSNGLCIDNNNISLEKTADEMFEELGYKKENNPEVEIKYIKDENHIIRFWKNSQSIIKQNEDGWYMSITMEELKAINKKVDELGWI